MISGMINYSKGHKSYLCEDSVFVNKNVIFCSDDIRRLTANKKYIILSENGGSAAVYRQSSGCVILICGTSPRSVIYYTFIGATLVFSSDIKDIVQKCRIVFSNDSSAESETGKLLEIAKNITAIPAGGKIAYTETGLITPAESGLPL